MTFARVTPTRMTVYEVRDGQILFSVQFSDSLDRAQRIRTAKEIAQAPAMAQLLGKIGADLQEIVKQAVAQLGSLEAVKASPDFAAVLARRDEVQELLEKLEGAA